MPLLRAYTESGYGLVFGIRCCAQFGTSGPHDVYATASQLIAGPIPASGPGVSLATSEAARKWRRDRELAMQILPFSIEAAVKQGVLLAAEGKPEPAIDWFEVAAARFRSLADGGHLAAVALAVILEILAEFCDRAVAAHSVPGGVVGQRARKVAVRMASDAVKLDPNNPKAQLTLAALSTAGGHGAHGGVDEVTAAPTATRCRSGGVPGTGDHHSFWYQLKSATVVGLSTPTNPSTTGNS